MPIGPILVLTLNCNLNPFVSNGVFFLSILLPYFLMSFGDDADTQLDVRGIKSNF